MKKTLIQFLHAAFFAVIFLSAGQLAGQEQPAPADPKTTMGEKSQSPAPTALKGDYKIDAACADLVIKKGCVNYTVFPEGLATTPTPKTIKVCQVAKAKEPKVVNICHKGAKKLKIKYEKLDKTTDAEFMPQKMSSQK